MTVFAVGDYRTNADLIVACRDLGYLSSDMRVWDATYGYGRFWTRWQPERLWATDLDPAKSPSVPSGIDVTNPPAHYWFDAIVLDPPYKLNGAPSRGGPATSDESYGVHEPRTWQDRHRLIREMIDGAVPRLAPKGRLLLKCQNQVCSGRVRWQVREFADHAEALGLTWTDELLLVGSRPQPAGRRQVHARRNYSSLLVFSC